MNAKFSLVLGLTRGYHQHSQYNRPQQLNRFSLYTWQFLLDKLKQELPKSKKKFPEYFKSIQNGLKMAASFLGKESSPILAQRAFRGYRILQLHSRLWSYAYSNPVSKRALLSFVMLSLCQSKNIELTIKEIELNRHVKDLDYIRELTAASVICHQCKDRLPVDKKIDGVKYCSCSDDPEPVFGRQTQGHLWVPFAETQDLLIWRQPHPDENDLYVYKVYGYYDDISAQDFLDAQLDIEYRKEWDDTALQLDVVETDSKSRSEVIYWEMKWPKMFTNRDYLFLRRHKVYKDRNDMVIMSKACTHPNCPERRGVIRVKEYWSVMHIRAPRGLSQTGVEFGLTYYDNPGVSLPQWLTNWAAKSGIPEFLNKQRKAARARRLLRESAPQSSISVSSSKQHCSDTKGQHRPVTSSSQNTSKKDSSCLPAKSNMEGTNVDVKTETNSNNNHVSSSSTIDSSINPSTAQQQPTTVSSSQQQEGKNELLSQFFKEQVLEVNS